MQSPKATSRTTGRRACVAKVAALAVTLCTAKFFSQATDAAEPNPEAPAATVQALCDVLLESMKKGAALDFAGRVKLLDAPVRRLYDLPLLTRLVVGPPWRGMNANDQQALVEAFSDYSIAIYASRFNKYSGERFVVDPAAGQLAGGDSVVHTKLLPASGDPVQLDYVLRTEPSGWHIIDVLLNGTISEMAERRSEYSSTLREGGASALVKLLRQKTEELQK